MATYILTIKWLNSVETVTINVDDLPESGAVIATTETWEGQSDPVDYQVDVLDVAQNGACYSLTLGYDERRNSELAGINLAWGTSTIKLDLRGAKPTAKATWSNDPPDPEFDGTTRSVKVTCVALDDLLDDLLTLSVGASPTVRETLIAARVGQGRFRSDVIKAWRLGETCALTGVAIPEMLVASHIKPWRECTDEERLHPANGLLLATHIDKLFDRFLLSFRHHADSTYVVELHPRVRKVAAELGLKESASLEAAALDEFEPRFRAFMQGHYERFLDNCKSAD